MKINIQEIIVKIKFLEERKLKAIISLDFGDFSVKGFRVMESPHTNDYGLELWFTPPSYSDKSGKYHPIFFIPDKNLWKELEKRIWEEYQKQQEEYYKKKFDLKDDET